jgi:aryl-alcohol dehydrogenase
MDLRLLGPLGCGFMTGSGTVLNSLSPEPGSSLVVFGTGAVGLAGMMAGVISNATHIIAVDINPERLEIAKSLGATETINSAEVDPVEEIMAITGGKGAQYALDTTGVPAVINSAIKSLAIKGELATVAVGKKPVEVDFTNDIVTFSRTIKGVIEGDAIPQELIPKLVEFYNKGQFKIDEISKLYAFSDINQAFEDPKKGVTVKPVVVIDESYSA